MECDGKTERLGLYYLYVFQLGQPLGSRSREPLKAVSRRVCRRKTTEKKDGRVSHMPVMADVDL